MSATENNNTPPVPTITAPRGSFRNSNHEMSVDELTAILGATIIDDDVSKVITFLCMLSAYTVDSQLNVSLNAPSSTGKSYIPLEVAKLFPEKNVMQLTYVTPSAFFHETGSYDKETNATTVDFSRRILVFLDQPHNELLTRLRPLLSHDQKELVSKITDKSEKGGNRTKTVIMKNHPAVVFCTAGLQLDQQEATRFILISPSTDHRKLEKTIRSKLQKEANVEAFKASLAQHSARQQLIRRIAAISQHEIRQINLASPSIIETAYTTAGNLQPQAQREVGHIVCLAKALALLNLWHRSKGPGVIEANDNDIRTAVELWKGLRGDFSRNLAPYVWNIYKEVILPAHEEKAKARSNSNEQPLTIGLLIREIIKKHLQVKGHRITEAYLKRQVLPALEAEGLIEFGFDGEDKRRKAIYLTETTEEAAKQNIPSQGGVTPQPATSKENFQPSQCAPKEARFGGFRENASPQKESQNKTPGSNDNGSA